MSYFIARLNSDFDECQVQLLVLCQIVSKTYGFIVIGGSFLDSGTIHAKGSSQVIIYITEQFLKA